MHHDALTVTGDVPRFREVLARAEYDDTSLVGIFGPILLPTRTGRDLPYFLRLTARGRRLDILARLFLLGVPVDAEAARRALDPVRLEQWASAGLIEVDGGTARACVRLLPFHGLLLACDHFDLRPSEQHDLVMGVTNSTIELADFAVRRKSRRTLDLGTGSGVQAFLAAPHSEWVCAVDSGARPLSFARFNAAFNGISNVNFFEGNAFEPVAGQTFDLVVSNPPFAITPAARYLYRDSGMALDGFCSGLVRQAPRFLNEGGYCQILCDWVHLAGQDWKERLAGWFEGSGCDAWVLRVHTHDPTAYAHVWIRDTEHLSAEESARLYEEWVAYYDRERVEAIGTGLIAMRRASRPSSRVRIEDAPESTSGAFGDHVVLAFELRDYLEIPDEKLLSAILRVAPAARLDQQCDWSEGAWRIASARIRLATGLQYASDIDLRLAGLVARCDGRHRLGDLLAQMASALGEDREKITPNCLAMMRQLIERGFLLPVE